MYSFDAPLTQDDYMKFNIYHASQSDMVKRQRLIARLIGPVLFMAVAIYAAQRVSLWIVAYFGVISLLWLVFYPKFAEKSMKRRLKKFLEEGEPGILYGSRHLSFDEDQIVVDQAGAISEYNWHHITKMVEDNHAVYLYVGNVQAIIMPKRAFNQKDEVEKFMAYVEGHL